MRRISLILLLGAAVAWTVPTTGCRKTASDENTPSPLVPVQVRRAEVATLHPTLELTGTVVAIPERSASVSSRAGGWVENVLITEGDTVEANQELIRLDPRIAQINVEKARSALMESEAVLARLRHGPLPEEIEVARSETDKAKAQVKALRGQFDAAKSLHDKEEISDVQYDKLASDLQAAEAALSAAEANQKLLEAGTRRRTSPRRKPTWPPERPPSKMPNLPWNSARSAVRLPVG